MLRAPRRFFEAFVVLGVAAVLMATAAHAEPQGAGPNPSEAMKMPFETFAQSKQVDAAELAAELGIPAGEDLSQPVAKLMRKHSLSREDMQHAMMALNPIAAEAAEKDWSRIRLKFILWVAFFLAAM